MTAHELELYRKCTKKYSKKKIGITRESYELEHEYNNETNENDKDIR